MFSKKKKYKSSRGVAQQRRKRALHAFVMWMGVVVVLGGVGFGGVKLVTLIVSPKAMVAELPKREEQEEDRLARVEARRMAREERGLAKERERMEQRKDREERALAKELAREDRGNSWWIFGKRGAEQDEAVEEVEVEPKVQVQQRRLLRSSIPSIDFRRVSYSRLFCDMNEEQLVAARANGIHHATSRENLDASEEVVRIKDNELYVIDTLTYSEPYLVPKASLMLDYIGLRFQEIMKERSRSMHDYRLVITSVLRSVEDNNKLRRYNCNATEHSCHSYGTTIDISYIRYMRDDGEIVNELWLKEALAMALYELRYEGICYVKYEYRQGCFHITVRDTEYKGPKASQMECYDIEDGELSLLAHQLQTLMPTKEEIGEKRMVEI